MVPSAPSPALLLSCVLPVIAQLATGAEPIAPARGHADADGRTVWYDATLLALEGKGWTDTAAAYDRLPARAKDVVRPPVWDLSHHSAGLCVRFVTDAPSIQVRWTVTNPSLAMPHMPATGVSGVDLYARDDGGRWQFVGNGRPAAVTNTATFGVVPGREQLLCLPLYNGVSALEVGVAPDRQLSPPPQRAPGHRRPILFYGTSITQGGCASRPGLAATSVVGRQLDVPVVNLGFSGSGQMEPAMASLLAELDPAVYVLDCLWNMSPDMVKERLEPFVTTLRQARPRTPIVLAEDSHLRDLSPTDKGRVLREAHARLVAAGVPGLHLLPNTGMLGADGEGTVDGCHPNDLGMMRQAAVFAKALAPLLQAGAAAEPGPAPAAP